MPNLPDSVQPGDLVTAATFNQLLLALRSMDARILGLEHSLEDDGALVILRILPTGIIDTGSEMTLFGRNFGASDENTVRIAGVQPISGFKLGSDNTILIFDVPPIAGLDPEGQEVDLTLSNPRGFVTERILVRPGATTHLVAVFSVTYAGMLDDGEITAGDSHVFLFAVHAATTRGASYGLTAGVNRDEWTAVVVDEEGSPLSPPTVEIPHSPQNEGGIDLVFGVRVTVPPGVADETEFQVSFGIMAIERPSQAGGRTVELVIGSEAPEPSTEVVVTLRQVFQAQRVGDTVVVVAGTVAGLGCRVQVERAGQYRIDEPSVIGDPDGQWTAELAVADTFPIGEGSFQDFQLTLAAEQGAPPAVLRIRVQELGSDGQPTGVVGELLQPITASSG